MPLDVRPKVFLSFAGRDRPHAESLRAELESRNVNAFLDEFETDATINTALATSDYYVLLWSSHTPPREWTTEEAAVEFAAEMARRRAFLFIVRLDEEPLPPLLAPRKHIDLVDATDRLVTTWRSDRKSELPVFPQPTPPLSDGPTVALSIRSHDLGVTHVVMAPLHLTGEALHRAVHEAMRLPPQQTNGPIGMRFSYRLSQQGETIHDTESTVELRSDVVDIEIRVESFGQKDLDELEQDEQRRLLVAAFRHLLP